MRAQIFRFRSVPNLITIGRLFLVPVVIDLIVSHRWWGACAIFLVAGLSDALDGWLAKTFDLRTELGSYLDPLADKALLVSIYVALAIEAAVPPALAILIVARDLIIVGAVLLSWLLRRPMAIRPLLISKINTVAQILVAAFVLALEAMAYPVGPWVNSGFYAVAALTLLSMAAYLQQWLRHMSA
ncbi:MAG: CDP-alcohol phosphatidyltransferase family protein [Beijerinckiaceae bacterium]|nr:CDP-alcohol phosphatidyltransferase family protein [Beijerinckiaceae bacterium]